MKKQELRDWIQGAKPIRTTGSAISDFERGYAMALRHLEEALNSGVFESELESLHQSTE